MTENAWYDGCYFNDKGWMATGWLQIDDRTYYMNPDDGKPMTGWQWIGDSYYFFSYEDGSMARDTVIDGYYVNADGVWIENAA